MNNIVKYSYPAKNFQEALPIGNGRIGGMVYGDAKKDRVSLNESSFWAGNPKVDLTHGSTEIYNEARRLTLEGKYLDAQQLIDYNFTGDFAQRYLALANLNIETEIEEYSDYNRILDMEKGIQTVTFTSNNISYKREYFVSNPDDIMAIRLTAAQSQSIKISYNSVMQGIVSSFNDILIFKTIAPISVINYETSEGYDFYSELDEEKGMRAIAGVKIITDGSFEIKNNVIHANGSDIVLLVSTQTSYVDYKTHPYTNGKDEVALCLNGISSASKKAYDELKNTHIKDFTSLYNRTELSLDNDDSVLDTDCILKEQKDNSIYTILFNYGKYLTISASRKGGNAMNLQGIWNEKEFAPWNSDYHLNINAEMNYMPTLKLNLDECFEPYITLTKELTESGRIIAKEWFGIDGTIVNHVTDVWRLANPVGRHYYDSCIYAYFPVALGWMLQGLYERYEITGDESFLKDTFYPLVEEFAETLIKLLYTDENGKMYLSPATSPENKYMWDDKVTCSVGKFSEMFNAITRDVFRMASITADKLNIPDKAKKYAEYKENIMPTLIGSDGRILEWDREVVERDVNHRHVSHLYALHPLKEITPYDTPELAQAAAKSLNVRGDEGSGWCIAWKANMWARLFDGNRALKLLDNQLNPVDSTFDVIKLFGGGTYPNLFCAHPPFQIDGNFGFTSAILEMLVQCNGNDLYILPALPDKWTNGHIKGIRINNGATVDIKWENSKATDIKILPEELSKNFNIIIK